MHVCVDRGTPGGRGGGVGAERGRGMFYRDAPEGWVPKTPISPVTSFTDSLMYSEINDSQRNSQKKLHFEQQKRFMRHTTNQEALFDLQAPQTFAVESPRLLERWVH